MSASLYYCIFLRNACSFLDWKNSIINGYTYAVLLYIMHNGIVAKCLPREMAFLQQIWLKVAEKPYFTGFLRVAFWNLNFATKLFWKDRKLCILNKYREQAEDLLYILYNGLFWNQKCPAVRMDIFVPTPGKKCSIFGIKIYQKRTMIYRDKNKCLYKFVDFHGKS